MRTYARTVLADVPADELGATYTHEHLVTAPSPALLGDSDDMLLDDEDRAAAELQRFSRAGGRTIADVTTREFGRNAAALRRLAARTGVHVIATTGHVTEEYWRGVVDVDGLSEDDLVREMVAELTEGIDGTDVRAGVIKVGSSSEGTTAAERKVIRAAARAQRETGAPITTHAPGGPAALEQIDLLERAGAELDHVCVGHLDRRLVWDEQVEIARRGVFLGYDCISKRHYESDETRADFIVRLVSEGFGAQICLSGDLARRSYLTSWGGSPGYRYILSEFVPLLVTTGLSRAATARLLVNNPARFLAWAT